LGDSCVKKIDDAAVSTVLVETYHQSVVDSFRACSHFGDARLACFPLGRALKPVTVIVQASPMMHR
jgi:hypothetical protein